jgi:hypothetical protein
MLAETLNQPCQALGQLPDPGVHHQVAAHDQGGAGDLV